MGYGKRYRRKFKFKRRATFRRRYRRTYKKSNLVRFPRRKSRTEIKYVDRLADPTDLPINSTTTFNITPRTVPKGVNEGERVGNQVRFRKALIHFEIWASNTFRPNPGRATDTVRMVIWTPRLSSDVAIAYMGTLSFQTIIDYNVVTIKRDMYVPLAYLFATTGTSGAQTTTASFTSNAAMPSVKAFTWTFYFPRKVKFPPSTLANADNVDEDKDIIFMTVFNQFTTPLSFRYYSRVTYEDS